MTTDQATTTAARIDAVADAAVATASRPPRLTGPRVIDNELIDAVANGHCGWSRMQLEILGVPWPAQSGWRQRLVAEGRILSSEEVDELYAARKTKRTAEADPAEIPVLPCPWCSRPVQRIEQGGNLREFCSRKHKNLFNAALTTASIAHSRLLRVPGALRTWTEARVNPSPSGGSALQAPETPNGKPERQDGPLAAPASPDVT